MEEQLPIANQQKPEKLYSSMAWGIFFLTLVFLFSFFVYYQDYIFAGIAIIGIIWLGITKDKW
jgi:hypothetical protein